MDFFGIKLLIFVSLISLIVFSGHIAPAYRQHLDTIYGRLIAVVIALLVTDFGGWPMGILTVIAILILMPTTVSEGFSLENKKRTTDKNRWFIERIMGEKPLEIDSDQVLNLPII